MNQGIVRREALTLAVVAAAVVTSLLAAYVARLVHLRSVVSGYPGYLIFMEEPGAAWWFVLPSALVLPVFLYLSGRPVKGRSVSAAGLAAWAAGLVLMTSLGHQGLSSHLQPFLWAGGPPVGWRIHLLSCVGAAVMAGAVTFLVVRRWGMEVTKGGPSEGRKATAGVVPAQTAVWFGKSKGRLFHRLLVVGAVVLILVVFRNDLKLALALHALRDDLGLSGGLVRLLWLPFLLSLVVVFLGFSLLYGRVRINREAVSISVGPWRLPVRRIELDSVSVAECRDVSPFADFGGYGVQKSGKATGFIFRAGEALWLRRGDRWIIITVEGAEEAAGVVNDLIESGKTQSELGV